MIELLTNALWITLSAYLLFIIGRWFYTKYLKEDQRNYFYFLSLKKGTETDWHLRLESPIDDFDILISVKSGTELLVSKNARLKTGINKITIPFEGDIPNTYMLLIKSSTQSIERPFIESEVN